MLGKTHMAVGIAATLAVTRPDTVIGVFTAISAGAVGALISDIDVDSSIANKKANQIIPLTIVVILIAVIADLVFHIGLLQRIWNHNHFLKIMTGIVGFVGICAFGKTTPHRSFMHSFLALGLLDIAIGLIYLPFVKYFTVGFLSHLATDILNKRKVRLFYPKKGGFSLKLFSAGGIANSIFFVAGSVLSVLEMILFLALIINK